MNSAQSARSVPFQCASVPLRRTRTACWLQAPAAWLVLFVLPVLLTLGRVAPADAAETTPALPALARAEFHADADPAARRTLAPVIEAALAPFRLAPDADDADAERELRRAERALRDALASEGYFRARLPFDAAPPGESPPFFVRVNPGPLTRVADVELKFAGAITGSEFVERLAALRTGWLLSAGAPFRSSDWERAKTQLLLAVESRDFAGARLTASEAIVDPQMSTASLSVEVDSGPAYRVGPLQITGLERYDEKLIARFNPFRKGDPYDRAKLIEFQQALQESPFFSSVLLHLQLDPALAEAAPLRVEVSEAKTKRFAAALGYGTDTGARAEVTYRQTILFGLPYTLATGVRADDSGQFAFADILLPPKPNAARDSFGVLGENSDIENQRVKRFAIGAQRNLLTGPRDGHNLETRYGLRYEWEERSTPSGPQLENKTLSTTATWTWRRVDSLIDPRAGNIVSLSGSVGVGRLDWDNSFVRALGRIQQYVGVGARDVLILRAEAGYVAADSPDIVPTEFLFRTGGSNTVRGYSYQSLGVEQGGAIVGGQALAVASAEYVHWLELGGGNWGIAAFVDAGDANTSFRNLDIAVGAGVGARWRTPAGPLAVDLAYGFRDSSVRVQFSVAIAF